MTPDGFRAVIFDLDGVLVDTEPRHFAALNRVLATEGQTLPPEANHQLLGLTLERTWDIVIARLDLTGSRSDYYARYNLAVLSELDLPLEPLPGVKRLLDYLAARGTRVALASSSRRAWVVATLRAAGLSDRFQATVAGDEVATGKPDPAIFRLAATRLAVEAADCLVIEDSPAGIEAGRRAGMRVLAVRTPLTRDLCLAADWVVESLADVLLTNDARPTTHQP